MDKDQVREWKRGYEAMNEITLQEARDRTPLERMDSLERHLRQLRLLGVDRDSGVDDVPFENWSELKRRLICAE